MDKPQNTTVIPVPSLRRLPSYLFFLKQLEASGRESVSCTHIASQFGQDATQVRKDLAAINVVGKPKVGYPLGALVKAIEDFLGWNSTLDACLVGTGNLGRALLGYQGFRNHGLNIVAVFDNDPAKIGTRIHDQEVAPAARLPERTRALGVEIGILTVPDYAAQACADLLVQGGIRAIWNFTPVGLQVPEGVIVQREDLSAGLAVLCCRLAAGRT